MVWIYTATEPKPVETRMHLGQKQRTVNYLIREAGAEDKEQGYNYRHKAVTLEPGIWHYDAIVDAIITAEYPNGRMQAIVNNYLADPTSDNAVEEMLEMQNDRAMAKHFAKEALAYIEAQEGVQNSQGSEDNKPPEQG